EKEQELSEIRKKLPRLDWANDRTGAEKIIKRESQLRDETEQWRKLLDDSGDAVSLAGDITLKDDLEKQLVSLRAEHDQLKKALRFNGPYDDHGVVLSIYAGAG